MILQLKIGRTYQNREGDMVKIAGRRHHTVCPFIGDDECHYRPDGGFGLRISGHGFDLVKECEPEEPKAEAPQPLPLCEAILEEIEKEWEAAPDDYYAAAMTTSKAIVRSHFAALSVEDLARALCGWRNGARSNTPFDEMPEAEQAAYRDQAQAVLRLLRRE